MHLIIGAARHTLVNVGGNQRPSEAIRGH
jgi:hypothetical protein